MKKEIVSYYEKYKGELKILPKLSREKLKEFIEDKDTGGIKICSADTKTKTIIDLENCLKSLGIEYSIECTRTTSRLCIAKQEYKEFFRQFGHCNQD